MQWSQDHWSAMKDDTEDNICFALRDMSGHKPTEAMKDDTEEKICFAKRYKGAEDIFCSQNFE